MEKLVGLIYLLGTEKSRVFFIFILMRRNKQFKWVPASREFKYFRQITTLYLPIKYIPIF